MKKLILLFMSSLFLFAADSSIDNTGNSDLIDKKNAFKEKIDSDKKQLLLQREANKPVPVIKSSLKVIPRDISKGQSMIVYSAKKNALNKAVKLNISSPELTTCINNSFSEESVNNCFKK